MPKVDCWASEDARAVSAVGPRPKTIRGGAAVAGVEVAVVVGADGVFVLVGVLVGVGVAVSGTIVSPRGIEAASVAVASAELMPDIGVGAGGVAVGTRVGVLVGGAANGDAGVCMGVGESVLTASFVAVTAGGGAGGAVSITSCGLVRPDSRLLREI